MKTNTNQRKINQLFLLLFFMSNTIIAQQVSIGNQKTIGGSYTDNGMSMDKLNNGYVSVIASQSNISFDRTEARKGNMDYWLVGLNNDLTIAWQKSYGGSMMDEVYDMIVTPSNDIIIVGVSDSPISNDKTVANYGSFDIWVVCTDSVGNIKWQNVYGGSSGEYYGAKIIKLNNNNYAIGTTSASNISGNKTEDSRGSIDYWVFSIDSLGNNLWDKTFGGSSWDKFSDLVQVSDEEIIVFGTSTSPVSGDKSEGKINDDPNHLSFEGRDLWIIKYNFVTNTVLWDKTLGGEAEEFSPIRVAYDGTYVYCLTSTISNISGTKTIASFGMSDLWLNKMDTAGNVVLQKVYGGSGGDIGSSIIVDDKNNLVVGASSGSPISGNKTEASISSDYWFLNIKTDGSIIWDKTILGNKDENLGDVLYNGGNSFIAIGGSNSNASGDKTESDRNNNAYEYNDAWIIELSTDVGISSSFVYNRELEVFPNPSSESITIRGDNDNIKSILLYNVTGKEVLNKQVNSEDININISGLPSGLYLIYAMLQNGTIYKAKFIKN